MAAPGSGSDLLLKLNEVVSRIEGTKRKLEDEEAAFHNFMASHQKRVRKLQSEKAYLEQQQAQLVAELQSSGGAALAAATAAPFHADGAAGNGVAHAPGQHSPRMQAQQQAVMRHPPQAAHAPMQLTQQARPGFLAICPMGPPNQQQQQQYQQYQQVPHGMPLAAQHQQYQQYQQHSQQAQPHGSPITPAGPAGPASHPPTAAASSPSLSPSGSLGMQAAVAAKEFVPRAVQMQAVQMQGQARQQQDEAAAPAPAAAAAAAAVAPAPAPPGVAAVGRGPPPGYAPLQQAAAAPVAPRAAPPGFEHHTPARQGAAARPVEKSPLAAFPIPGQPPRQPLPQQPQPQQPPQTAASPPQPAPAAAAPPSAPAGPPVEVFFADVGRGVEVDTGEEGQVEGVEGEERVASLAAASSDSEEEEQEQQQQQQQQQQQEDEDEELRAAMEAAMLASASEAQAAAPQQQQGQQLQEQQEQEQGPRGGRRPGWGRGSGGGAIADGGERERSEAAAAAAAAAAAGSGGGGGGYLDLLEGDYGTYVRRQQAPTPQWSQPELVEQDFPCLGAPAAASNGKVAPASGGGGGGGGGDAWGAAAASKWGAGGLRERLAGAGGSGWGRSAAAPQQQQQQAGGPSIEEVEARCGLRAAGDATPDTARRRQVQRQAFELTETQLKQRRKVNVLEGLELHRGVLTAAEQELVVEAVHRWVEMGRMGRLRGRTFSAPKKWLPGKGRVTMQFGCCYNYAVDSEGRPPGIIPEELVEPMPPMLRTLCRRLTRWGVLPAAREPNSAIINIYEEGDCIPPHVDSHDFIRPFCTLSLLSEQSIMFAQKLVPAGPGVFEPREGCTPALIPLPQGSCLVLKGHGGDHAMHCVPPVASPRISITLRRMAPEFDAAVAREVQSYERRHGPLHGFWADEEGAAGEAAARGGRRSAGAGAITIK